MASLGPKKTAVKRKHSEKEDVAPVTLKLSGLEMLTDEEDDYDPNNDSDDGEVDEFPEIDPSSDSEGDDEDGLSDEENGGEEDEEESDEEGYSSAGSELNVFPKSKTVISDITGQPKKVYPEIEPDYDSDSSTEEVCLLYVDISELH
jgi:ribosome biogenesis protein ERB1